MITTTIGIAGIEQEVIKRFVKNALAAGYSLSIDNGGDDYELEKSRDRLAILNSMQEAQEDTVYLFRDGSPEATGFVQFIYGNEGWDVISDHTDTLEMRAVLAGAQAVADSYEPQ